MKSFEGFWWHLSCTRSEQVYQFKYSAIMNHGEVWQPDGIGWKQARPGQPCSKAFVKPEPRRCSKVISGLSKNIGHLMQKWVRVQRLDLAPV